VLFVEIKLARREEGIKDSKRPALGEGGGGGTSDTLIARFFFSVMLEFENNLWGLGSK
jgi:hypothetical protein